MSGRLECTGQESWPAWIIRDAENDRNGRKMLIKLNAMKGTLSTLTYIEDCCCWGEIASIKLVSNMLLLINVFDWFSRFLLTSVFKRESVRYYRQKYENGHICDWNDVATDYQNHLTVWANGKGTIRIHYRECVDVRFIGVDVMFDVRKEPKSPYGGLKIGKLKLKIYVFPEAIILAELSMNRSNQVSYT